MNEKNFSMVVMAFVFVVAIPSVVFLFSDSFNSTGEAQLHISPQGVAYAYQKEFQYGPDNGVKVPIYDENGNVIYHEEQVRTDQKSATPYYSETFTGMRQGCPQGYMALNYNEASQYISKGRHVLKFGDQYCWKPKNT